MTQKPVATTQIDAINKVSSKSVLKHTGKTWDQWIALLDKAGARAWTYQKTTTYLKTRQKLTIWWQHGVTQGYEIQTGKRVEGQNQKGEYSTTATKTLPIDGKAAWALMFSPKGLALWLNPLDGLELKPGSVYEVAEGAYGQVRTIKPGKRIRLSWQESHWRKASFLQLYVLPRAKGKSMVVLMHDTLATAEIKNHLKARWRKALDDLWEISESSATSLRRTASPKRK